MSRYIFDCETNGLLDTLDRVHCLVLKDIDTGEVYRMTDDGIAGGLMDLSRADLIVGHNVIKFDIPALTKVYPWFTVDQAKVRDTIVLTRLIWPEIKKRDIRNMKTKGFPGQLCGKHSLEAWGHRIGNYKGDFKGPWDQLTAEMLDYCVQDVEVTAALWQMIEAKNYSAEAVELEHEVAWIIAAQERNGFAFNVEKAKALLVQLRARQLEVEAELKAFFPPWEVRTPFTPKANNKARGYVKGVPTFKSKTIVFNPAARDHIADRLMKLYDWKPAQFTDGGKPQVDEKVLAKLSYPPCKMLHEYLLLEKRIGQLADGKEAWLKHERNGRIYGGVVTNGAVTGRMTHSKPNVAQVPKVGSAYGAECRELFESTAGWVLVGIDASGLELRMLAHYMARWDAGAYAKAVVEGRQEDGTDVHTLNCIALGMDPKGSYVILGRQQTGRNCSKTFIYAFLYGAGDEKIGSILGVGKVKGGKKKVEFLDKTPALKSLKKAVANRVKLRGFLVGLDGRHLEIRSEHAALNTLLQSAGAIVMKRALVLFNRALIAAGYLHGRDYRFVANVHDEWQIETKQEIAQDVGRIGVQAIRDAGVSFGFRCPLDGEFKVGANWRDTH